MKTIETRPNRTHVRGRIAIHAAAKRPAGGWYNEIETPPPFIKVDDRIIDRLWDTAEDQNGTCSLHWRWRGPLGAIVATANLVDCVPMIGANDDPVGRHLAPVHFADGDRWYLADAGLRDVDDVTDQTPYGDFAPGRWAWILEDVQPLAEPVPFKGGQGWSRSWEPFMTANSSSLLVPHSTTKDGTGLPSPVPSTPLPQARRNQQTSVSRG